MVKYCKTCLLLYDECRCDKNTEETTQPCPDCAERERNELEKIKSVEHDKWVDMQNALAAMTKEWDELRDNYVKNIAMSDQLQEELFVERKVVEDLTERILTLVSLCERYQSEDIILKREMEACKIIADEIRKKASEK